MTYGDHTAITPGFSTLYRVWLLGREVCATNSASLAVWAEREAIRYLSRAPLAKQQEADSPVERMVA